MGKLAFLPTEFYNDDKTEGEQGETPKNYATYLIIYLPDHSVAWSFFNFLAGGSIYKKHTLNSLKINIINRETIHVNK